MLILKSPWYVLHEVFLRDEIRVTEISKDINTSKGLVSRFLKEMEKESLLLTKRFRSKKGREW